MEVQAVWPTVAHFLSSFFCSHSPVRFRTNFIKTYKNISFCGKFFWTKKIYLIILRYGALCAPKNGCRLALFMGITFW